MTTATLNRWEIGRELELKLNFDFSAEAFADFCRLNQDLRIERDQTGNIHIMPPTGFNTGRFNADIGTELNIWNRKKKLGVVGESNTGYQLPNGAVRSPDISWVAKKRLDALSADELEKFAPICPDFVIEIASPSDNLVYLKDKMEEYIENGTRLGWLIDRKIQKVFIYRTNGTIDLLESFDDTLSGEDVLPGFSIKLSEFKI